MKQRFMDGTPVDADYANLIATRVGGAASAIEAFGEDELERYATELERQNLKKTESDLKKHRLDEWCCTAMAPTSVPDELKLGGSVFRGMRDLDAAKAYAREVAAYFASRGIERTIFVVKGPTSTTRAAFEVVDACCGYTVVLRIAAASGAAL